MKHILYTFDVYLLSANATNRWKDTQPIPFEKKNRKNMSIAYN